MNGMTIGKVAARTGVGIETLRFYERQGLIAELARRPSGYRDYPPAIIERGWRRKVRERLGGSEGCTHLLELPTPLTTVAFQTLRPYRRQQVRQQLAEGEADLTTDRPAQLNTCYSWSPDRGMVRRRSKKNYCSCNCPKIEYFKGNYVNVRIILAMEWGTGISFRSESSIFLSSCGP